MGPLAVTVSDSLPAADVALWLSRCPTSGAPAQGIVSVACELSSEASSGVNATSSGVAFSLMQASGIAAAVQPVSLPCSADGVQTITGSSVAVPVHVAASAEFRSPAGSAELACSLTGSDSARMGSVALAVTVVPTLWPIYDDCVTIAQSGMTRSTTFGSLNASALLLAQVIHCARGATRS